MTNYNTKTIPSVPLLKTGTFWIQLQKKKCEDVRNENLPG